MLNKCKASNSNHLHLVPSNPIIKYIDIFKSYKNTAF